MNHYYLFGRSCAAQLIERTHTACFRLLGLQDTHKFVGSVGDPHSYRGVLMQDTFAGASLVRHHSRGFEGLPTLGIANRLGSVNALVKQQGYLVAYNTDYAALRSCLDEYQRVRSAVVLGNGPLVQTVSYYLQKRNIPSGELVHSQLQSQIKRSPKAKYLSWLLREDTAPSLVIATSTDHSEVNWHWLLRNRPVVIDLSTENSNSQLVERAKQAGCSQVISSREYLIQRTLEQNYLFTGQQLNTLENRKSLLKEMDCLSESARI